MKKTKLKRKSNSESAKIQRKLWKICVDLCRKLYGNTCYTCGKTGLSGKNWHTGHFLPRGSCGAYLKYDIRNLRPQCYNCNINLGGNGALFMRNMVIREGQDYVNKLFSERNLIVKGIDRYIFLLEDYKLKLKIINQENN